MKATKRKVHNIRWEKSRSSGLMFRVGYVVLKKAKILVFEASGTWLTADPSNFRHQ